MNQLIYFTFIYGTVLLVYGFLNYGRTQKNDPPMTTTQKMWTWVNVIAGLSAGAFAMFAIIAFLITNAGKNVGLHDFDQGGLKYLLYISAATGLTSILFYLKTKKWWPELIVAILSIIQLLITFMLMFYFQR